MNERIDAFILIDNRSREIIKNDIMNLISHNIVFISDFCELTPEQLKRSRTIVVLEPYLTEKDALPKLRVFKQLLGLDFVFITSNKNWLAEIESLGRMFVYDTSVITYEVVQAAVLEDKALEQKEKSPVSLINLRAIANSVLNDTSFPGNVHRLAETVLAMENSKDSLQKQLINLQQRNRKLESEFLTVQQSNQKLREGYAQIFDEVNTLNKTLQQYETYISAVTNNVVNISDYKNRPNIVYLKEYESLHGIDLFLHTLYNVIRTQLQNSVKVVRLYDNKSSTKMLAIPDYYTVLTNDYLDSQVIASNFIAKSGDYSGILDLLLTNKTQLDTLVILDCRNVNNTVISGSILQLGICGDAGHVKAYGIDKNIAIVNNASEPEYLNFNYDTYKTELGKLQSDYERFMYLSSQEVYQRILSLIELQRSML